MRSQVTLQSGQKGIKKLLIQHETQLVRMRYHYDEEANGTSWQSS